MAVLLDISMSLDGFIAQPNDDPGPIHEWFFGGAVTSRHNEAFKTSGPSSEVLDETFTTTGAILTGRRTYDLTQGWGGSHPMPGVPVFVVTHEAPREVPEGATTFTFVTDGIERAIAQARAAAGVKNVIVMGGAAVARQCIEAGLLDEVQIHLAPVLLGDGVRLFEDLGSGPIELDVVGMVDAPDVTHLRYRVVGPGPGRS